MSVRVRFAPSPTGFLHVGGLRTALYNYLFARHNGGKCILRIEDTDQTRYVESAETALIEACRWAGFEFDESPEKGGEFGPYRQSERTDIYQKHAQILLANGSAYYSFDTSEELDKMRERQQKAGLAPKYDRSIMRNQLTLGEEETARLLAANEPFVVRLKVPVSGDIRFSDIVRGEVVFAARDIDDQILLKSDGFPTYHLANVVDDHLMQISHVIRAEEWLPSTPKHVLLYQAFGWESPKFAHVPLLLNPDKTKMSKRHGDVFVDDFKNKGFFPEALVNFVALCGWNPSSEREIYSMNELIEHFALEKVNKAGAIFDYKKLEWMNSQYFRSYEPAVLAPELLKILDGYEYPKVSVEYAAQVIGLLRERINFLHDVPTFGDYMFTRPLAFDDDYKSKHWKPETNANITPLVEIFKALPEFSHQALHDVVQEYVASKQLALKFVIHPLRLMITGKQVGAGMFETMAILGREEVLARMTTFLENNP